MLRSPFGTYGGTWTPGPNGLLGSTRRPRYRAGVVAFVVLAVACTAPEADYGSVFDGSAGRWIDLTHGFGDSTIYWPTDSAGFELDQLAFGEVEGGWFYAAYAFSSAEHGGTHLDAPIHFSETGLTADEIPLAGLIGPAAVVDVVESAHADYQVTVSDLERWEAEHGALPDGGILLLRTGWGARWPNRPAYLGTDRQGPDAVADLHFPGLAPEAARWLVENRGTVAVGIDTPSIDYGQSSTFEAHVALYAENVSGFENVANLDVLPEVGAYVVALPMKIEGGSGAPLRIVAFVPSSAGR